ncbi:hypothetical protein HK101_007206 [Irineochytrium annulatum]|nr:hypothetical protein HK101_007206 [Irineochytrium annulatum]
MNPAEQVLTVLGLTAAAASTALYFSHRYLRRLKLGGENVPDVTTRSVAYDRDRHGRVLSWDAQSFRIDGRPIVLASGEFHPWRVPDRTRWKALLETYKEAGLNCIRIYFHWGFHSPAEGVYHFDGNRDMDYLLSLCEELHLFVLAAPGPYICAETQAGAIPHWVLAKRDIRIRHSVSIFHKQYDAQYSAHCRSWLLAILPIIARHQITEPGRKGCVLALQIENENFETLRGFPIGLSDDMRFLADVARRECNIQVPLFHNDAFEEGSFVAKPESFKPYGKEHFGLDLYSFDKYVVFAPTSAPTSLLVGGEDKQTKWKEWTSETVEQAVDNMEKAVRGFGGSAASAPIFIAELQGGWFNHYQLKCTYDTIYDYYGEDYTRLLVESVFAQGVTAFNIYMFYGGTNWGSLGDTDVYTSYDYSACIREHGHLSGRARMLRLTLAFLRSFSTVTTRTMPLPASAQASCKPAGALNRERVSIGDEEGTLTFFRNFSRTGATSFEVKLTTRPTVTLQMKLAPKRSFIGLGHHESRITGLKLMMSTAPIHLRTKVVEGGGRQVEVWICEGGVGEMAFDGQLEILEGDVQKRWSEVGNVTVLDVKGRGWWRIKGKDGKGDLVLAVLGRDEVYTLSPTFEEPYWVGEKGAAAEGFPTSVGWGCYGIRHDVAKGECRIETSERGSETYLLLSSLGTTASQNLMASGFVPVFKDGKDAFGGLPNLVKRKIPDATISTFLDPLVGLEGGAALASLSGDLGVRVCQFNDMPWRPIKLKTATKPAMDVIDLGYISSHLLYRVRFRTPAKTAGASNGGVTLTIDMRNRATLYVNGRLFGGNTTYSLQMMRAGAKNGPDPFADRVSYRLDSSWLMGEDVGEEEVVIVIESYGLSRQAFVLNDVRNGRGLLEVSVRPGTGGDGLLSSWMPMQSPVKFSLEAAGVDVATVSQPFGITGFPDESKRDGWVEQSAGDGDVLKLQHGDAVGKAPVWFRGTLKIRDVVMKGLVGKDGAGGAVKAKVRCPLRLKLTGPGTAHVVVDGIYLARYRGNGDSVQRDFIIPDGLVEQAVSARGGKLEFVALVYGWSKEDWVGLEVVGWEIAMGEVTNSEAWWSGNLNEGGSLFCTVQESLKA